MRLRGRRARPPQRAQRVDRIAFCGPLPPAASGVATYDRAVLDGLARIGYPVPVEPIWPVGIDAMATVPRYRLAVYQMGNSVEYHLNIFRLLWSHPGLVVLHDMAIDGFARGLAEAGDGYSYAVLHREALDAAERLRGDDALSEPMWMPWAAAVARRARGIIVHAEFCRRYLEQLGCRTPIFVVPHPAVETPEAIARAEERGEAIRAARGASTLVVAPGELNATKGIEEILAAAGSLPAGAELTLVGRNPAFDVAASIRAAGVGDRVQLVLDAPDDEFLAHIASADIVLELRHPHRGEVSGSLARAMQLGKPSIVSGTGTYLDAPAGTVLAIAPGPPDVEELTAAIALLVGDRDRRVRMGATARAAAEALAGSDATAHGYAEAMTATMRIVNDPMRAPMDRWATALRDIGVTHAHIEAGYGLSYVRAAESFTEPS